MQYKGIEMSCLTRKLQQNLARHIKKQNKFGLSKSPTALKDQLVNEGVCPTHITVDQINEIVRMASR